MDKIYLLIAHCADGDISVTYKGQQYYKTYESALEAQTDFEGIHPTEIVEFEKVVVF